MMLPVNREQPKVMHIDLNSCFATIEQQANPLLRGKPIAVAAYNSPNGCILAPSIEAKRFGIKTGMRVKDAQKLYKDLVVLTPDPPKYRTVQKKFLEIFKSYSPTVSAKSIDEAVIDFHGIKLNKDISSIGMEIKQRIREEIGEWISSNVGISTNRFLAKLASSLHKPDGLDVITHKNLIATYKNVGLRDLHGINFRYEARLNAFGIFTPLDFFNAPLSFLKKQVFKGISGYYWYLRLRGWEIDSVDFKRRSFGQSYALKYKTADPKKLYPLLLKLCEKMARRIRKNNLMARGVHVACSYTDGTYWHKGEMSPSTLYSTFEFYKKAKEILEKSPQRKSVAKLAVSAYGLMPRTPVQQFLFETTTTKLRALSKALDKVNDMFGEYTIAPATMLGLKSEIIDRIAFGK